RSSSYYAISASLLHGLLLFLLRVLVRRGRYAGVFFAFDGDLANLGALELAGAENLVHQFAVHLLVLVRQGILVAAERNDDILLARLRIGDQADGHLSHARLSSDATALCRGGSRSSLDDKRETPRDKPVASPRSLRLRLLTRARLLLLALLG